MRNARAGNEWDRTSSLMALLANCHRSKGRAYKPGDFHPMAKEDVAEDLDDDALDHAIDRWLSGPTP